MALLKDRQKANWELKKDDGWKMEHGNNEGGGSRELMWRVVGSDTGSDEKVMCAIDAMKAWRMH